jgi:hypothetical protein
VDVLVGLVRIIISLAYKCYRLDLPLFILPLTMATTTWAQFLLKKALMLTSIAG